MEVVDARLRRSPDDWVRAATELLASGGTSAVVVESLAARLGATKGSFYWHFANREALLHAVLAAWVDHHTEAVIRHAEQEPDSRLRLRRLFDRVMNGTDRAVELRLLASTDDPAVSTALATVTERRIGFVTECFAALGIEGDAARQHAVLAYTSFLGLMQTEHISGGHLFDKLDRNSYLGFVEERLEIP